eukprot:m.211686 g.211686  ORF g.211686 m.211686 type:complete len:55 (-) comp15066_c1_seq3:1753-1917(-)
MSRTLVHVDIALLTLPSSTVSSRQEHSFTIAITRAISVSARFQHVHRSLNCSHN